MTDGTVTLTGDQVADMLGFSATFSLIEDAIQNLEMTPLQDDEVAALPLLPEAFRMRITARLVELAEMMRESLRELDGRVMQLTARS